MTGVKSQRLFFALWPDPGVRRQLAEAAASLPLRGGRLTHAEDLHITLNFLGKVLTEQMELVQQAASSVSCRSFLLRLDVVDCWPRAGIVWCGPTEIPRSLSGLANGLKEAMRECGFPQEKRPFKPHVTFARNGRIRERLVLPRPIEWRVEAFVLVSSNTGGEPPRYTVLKKWPMGS